MVSLLATGSAAAAPEPDHPPFVFETDGVMGVPWGAGNYHLPQQLFWEEGMADDIDAHLMEMQNASAGVLSEGRMPVLSCITTSPDLLIATGGDAELGVRDESATPGWAEWGQWRASHPEYDAITWDGEPYFPPQGYISPMMPMAPEDWPAGIENATYGDWSGDRLGRLALRIGARGIFAADAVEGLPGGHLDFAPAAVAAFAAWVGEPIPPGTVVEQADYILTHLHPEWNDFRAHAIANFYARVAQPIIDAGLTPLVGAQTNLNPIQRRMGGTDYRIFLEHVPAEYWYFNYELQSDGGRALQPWWQQVLDAGLFASREPDMPMGVQIDCDIQEFWDAVANLGEDEAWGRRYLSQHLLGVGWVHVAKRDGSVRRAIQAIQRSYWDAGTVDAEEHALIMERIPRRPFGAAIYYSVQIERAKERASTKNSNWFLEATMQQNACVGAAAGYFVSDAALDALQADAYPDAWIVLGAEDLTDAERAKLEAIAPVFADPYTPDQEVRRDFARSLPIHFEGDGLSGFSFVDQYDEVVLLVSNCTDTATSGHWVVSGVPDGTWTAHALLGASEELSLVVEDGRGRLPLELAGNETKVYALAGLVEPRGEATPPPVVEGPSAEEDDTGHDEASRGCGCRQAQGHGAPGGAALVFALLALVGTVRLRRHL